ncbi:MAG: ABC transporter ATP-binding protein [Desulfarculaceae bacterium]|nr:ABC transporter ATP-binding protein [Desulfarculaceae bacterium]
MLLRAENITVRYAKATAVDNVSIEVAEGSRVAFIGSNGAGKTTILRALSGMHPISAGKIWFQGRRIDGLKIHDIVKQGLIQVPEGRRLFPDLTVQSNLRLGAYPRKDKRAIDRDVEQMFEQFPRLQERRNQKAGTMSGGEQQMLAIARAIMGRPKLLLLDEPSLGLAPLIVEELAPVIKNINRTLGAGIILVEQNVPLALKIAQQGYVLHLGKVIQQGPMDELKDSEAVRRAYLGG